MHYALANSYARTGIELCLVFLTSLGNGPSAMMLSVLLSGHWPYFSGSHPDELLSLKLMENMDKSLVEQVFVSVNCTYHCVQKFVLLFC